MRTLALLLLLTVGCASEYDPSNYTIERNGEGEYRVTKPLDYPDSAVSESYTGKKWWRPWDSMGPFLEEAYRTRAVVRYTHPNAVPPDPFIEYLRRQR